MLRAAQGEREQQADGIRGDGRSLQGLAGDVGEDSVEDVRPQVDEGRHAAAGGGAGCLGEGDGRHGGRGVWITGGG